MLTNAGRRLLPVALLLALSVGCRTAAVYNVDSRPYDTQGLSQEELTKRVDRAARMQDWTVEQTGPGAMIVTKRRGRHVASSTLRYDANTFSVTLRNSIDLKQSADGASIHKLYNVWVQRLEETIVREVAAPN